MKGDDISLRLVDLAVAALRLVSTLEDSPTGKHIARQLIRSSTSGGANYEEARSAESHADFIHKVGIAAKEVRETVYWLRLTHRAGLSKDVDVQRLLGEGMELVAILTASVRTARARLHRQDHPVPAIRSLIPVPVTRSGPAAPTPATARQPEPPPGVGLGAPTP